MSGRYIYLQQALPRVLIPCTQAVKKKWKLRVRFSPIRRSAACIKQRFRRRLTKAVPHVQISVTECLASCVCVLFPIAKSMLRMGGCVHFY